MVPVLSIIFMFVSTLISIGLPVALFLVWRKKYGMKVVPMLIGVATFILFALVLQPIMHYFVLSPRADGSIGLIMTDPALYVLYAILAAGIFEETGRFIAFHIIKKKYSGYGTGLSYGIGHGGIEAILLVGLAVLNSIILSFMINTNSSALLGLNPSVQTQIGVLITTEPLLFLTAGIERIIAVSLHISLSIFVWCAVKVKGKLWLYPAAILIHAVFNIAPAMYQAGMIRNVWLTEAVIFIMVVPTAIFAFFICKIIQKNDDNQEKETMQ